MKVGASSKRHAPEYKVVRCDDRLYVISKKDPRYKQRQG